MKLSKLKKMMTACGVAAVTLAVSPASSLIPAYAADAEWTDKLAADVNESSHLNVRESATTDSDVVGKLYPGSVASVEKTGDEWVKITSGSVEGYVKSEFCAFGDAAKALAEKAGQTIATVTGDSVRVRAEANTDARIYALLDKGDTLTVRSFDSETDGWVSVTYDGIDAFISADYVNVKLQVEEAVSIEEEQAAIAKAAEEAAAEEAAAEEAAAEEAAEEEEESSFSSSSSASYSSSGGSGVLTKSKGVNYYNGHRETWYSQRVLPGGGLNIPGRHVNSAGLVCDGDGYICVASSDYSKGTVVETSLGTGKVYDSGCASGTIDIYTDW